jgi:hypothetical protein
MTLLVLAMALAGRSDEEGDRVDRASIDTGRVAAASASARARERSRRGATYDPNPAEPYAGAKRLAGRIAQAITTYSTTATARSVATRIPTVRASASLVEQIAPLIRRGQTSSGEVVYGQLSGVTPSSVGVMVIVRQYVGTGSERRAVSRVIDVRLKRGANQWSLASIGSVGGSPVPRPEQLSGPAQRVVDHPDIALPDTARWDIHRGAVDDALLTALAEAADRRPIGITVLRTGHPRTVWATSRPSAHSRGYAADVYAVDGRPVIQQRTVGSRAFRLARELLAGGASQVGSPWVLPPGAPRSFSDAVHQDHLHLQQRPVPSAAK